MQKGPPPRAKSVVDLWLGQQLRQLRKARGKSLTQVAAACDISVGLLSQIERGLSSISIRTLHGLAGALEVNADALLRNAGAREGEAGGRVARAGTHRLLPLAEKGIVKEIVTPPQGRSMDLCRVSIAPGGATGDESEMFSTERGEQVGVVLEGTLELWIENDVVLLQAGDSFCYPSRAPRRWCNPGSVTTQVIWAISNTVVKQGKT